MPLNNNSSLKTTIDGFENLKNVVNNNRIALRDKLEDKNIEVSENERLSSLINKVDGLGAIDIITVTELPPIGRENQLAIITDRNANNIVLSIDDSHKGLDENDIFINLSSVPLFKVYDIKIHNALFKLYLNRVSQIQNGVSNRLLSYKYKNGEWVNITGKEMYLYDNGAFPNFIEIGEFYSPNDSDITNENNILSIRGPGKEMKGTFEKQIDVTNYTTLKVIVTSFNMNDSNNKILYIGLADSLTGSFPASFLSHIRTTNAITKETELSLDISNVIGYKYLYFWSKGNYSNSRPTLKIKKMWLE